MINQPFPVIPPDDYDGIYSTYVNAPEQSFSGPVINYAETSDLNVNGVSGWRDYSVVAYIATIFQRICGGPASAKGAGIAYSCQGAGRLRIGSDYDQTFKPASVLARVTHIPPNVSSLFGLPNLSQEQPWQILGRCGWTASGYYGPTMFLNHQSSVFQCTDKGYDGFWYLLAPGVVCDFYMVAEGSYTHGTGYASQVEGIDCLLTPDNINNVPVPNAVRDFMAPGAVPLESFLQVNLQTEQALP